MDLGLNHLGQTLAVGGFAIYAVLFLVRVCRPNALPAFFSATNGQLQLQHAAVYLALVLATGVVLEDVSKSCAAGRAWFCPDCIDSVLDSDNELRLRSLFDVKEFSDEAVEAEPRNVLRELKEVVPDSSAVRSYLDDIGDHTTEPGRFLIEGKVAVDRFLRAIDGVFYYAKNTVYREESYFRELSDISDRIDFTRSLTFLFLIFFVLYLLFGLVSFLPQCSAVVNSSERRRVFCLAALYFVGVLLVGTAYRTEVNNYDLRVFGYYVSLYWESAREECDEKGAGTALPVQ